MTPTGEKTSMVPTGKKTSVADMPYRIANPYSDNGRIVLCSSDSGQTPWLELREIDTMTRPGRDGVEGFDITTGQYYYVSTLQNTRNDPQHWLVLILSLKREKKDRRSPRPRTFAHVLNIFEGSETSTLQAYNVPRWDTWPSKPEWMIAGWRDIIDIKCITCDFAHAQDELPPENRFLLFDRASKSYTIQKGSTPQSAWVGKLVKRVRGVADDEDGNGSDEDRNESDEDRNESDKDGSSQSKDSD